MITDTSEAIAEKVRSLLAEKTADERLAMASSMFEAARELMSLGIRGERSDLTENELKVALFERMYGLDFTEAQRKIIRHRLGSR